MTIIEQSTEKTNTKKNWWIEFDPTNGKVYKVSPRKPKENKKRSLLNSENDELCKQIISGLVNISKCSVVQDIISGEFSLEKKKNELIIKNIDNKLYRVTLGNPIQSDISVILYKKENYVRLVPNLDSIKKTMNLVDLYSVTTEDHTLMNLYVTQKGDPDLLIGTLEVDPLLLFERGSVLFDISDILKIHTVDEIDIWTNKLFSNYNLEIQESAETYTITNKNKNLIKKSFKNREGESHININIKDGLIELQSFINPITDDYKLMCKQTLDLMFFDGDVDNYCGMFSIPSEVLLEENKVIRKYLDFTLPNNPIILFKDQNLVINYVGD